MDEYRSEYAAARSQVEALERELEESKRELAEAKTLAHVHETSASTLERRLKQTKPRGAAQVVAILGTGMLFGFVIGAAFADTQRRAKLRDDVLKTLSDCEKKTQECKDAVADCKHTPF